MTLEQKLFHFQGRIRRRDYWLCSILTTLFALCVAAVAVLGFGAGLEDENLSSGIWLIALWPNLALGVKRLHDRGRSGWFCVPFLIVPGILQEVPARLEVGAPVLFFVNVWVFVLLVWGLVEMGLRDSVPGTNRFGPSPKSSQTPIAMDDPALPGGSASA